MSSCDLPVKVAEAHGWVLELRDMSTCVNCLTFCWHMLSWKILYTKSDYMLLCATKTYVWLSDFQKKQYFANFDSCLSPKIFIIIPWWFCLRLDKDIQHKTIHIQSALLANLSILELRDMMAFAITRGWWWMLSWEILYFPHIQVTVALGNIVSSKRHYIEEYCKL